MDKKILLINAITMTEELGSSDELMNFISTHQQYFADIPLRLLPPNECFHPDSSSEALFIYLIGSYLYFNVAGEPVTWLTRRKFAEFPFSEDWNTLFRKTLSSSPVLRFQSLEELKEYLQGLLSVIA